MANHNEFITGFSKCDRRFRRLLSHFRRLKIKKFIEHGFSNNFYVDGVKPLINFFKVFLLNLCFFEPTWSFYLKLNLSKTIYFLKRTWFLYVLSKYQGMFKILQWNAILQKTPTLKITWSSPRNSVFIGHASNPP